VPDREPFEYVLLRVVPRVDRGECINVGVILICRPRRYLSARIELDRDRLAAIAPSLPDETVTAITDQLEHIARVAEGDPKAGPIASLSQTERWHWLSAPSSTIIQPSPVHTGLCQDPGEEITTIFEDMVLVSKRRACD
jgi:hypothetical protein